MPLQTSHKTTMAMTETVVMHNAHPLLVAIIDFVRAEALKTPGAPVHPEYVYLVNELIENMGSEWRGVPGCDRLQPSWGPRYSEGKSRISLVLHELLAHDLVPPKVFVLERPGNPLPWCWVFAFEGHPCGSLDLHVETGSLDNDVPCDINNVSLWRTGVLVARACSPHDLATCLVRSKGLRPDAFLYLEHYLPVISYCLGTMRRWSDGRYDMAALAALPECPARLRVFGQLMTVLPAGASPARDHWFATSFRAALASGWYVGLYASRVWRAAVALRPQQMALLLAAGLDPDWIVCVAGMTELAQLCGAKRDDVFGDNAHIFTNKAWPLRWTSAHEGNKFRAWNSVRGAWAVAAAAVL
jgi:hypothetical protein